MKKRDALLVILGILFISFNLRAPITAVGSIVDLIQAEYGLSKAAAGFITTLPLLAFAVVSPFVATLSGKIGAARTMMCGLILILCGELIRSYTGAVGLYAGTAVIGVGIAIGNVIIPGIIKANFAERVGAVTSIYTSGMCIYAAVGAGISVPLAKGMNLGWKNALASWFILTVITVFIWLPQVRGAKAQNSAAKKSSGGSSIWSSRLAWFVTLFMGVQSLLFYSLVAWLPTVVTSKGLSDGFAGSMATLFQLMAIPATLLIPTLCDKFRDQRILVLVTCLIYALGMLCFLLGQTSMMLIVAVVLMAIGMGGSISLSIAFISLRSPNPARASQLSGMSQSAGYLLAAAGPVMTGALYDSLQSWTVPLILFIVLIAVLAFCGLTAGSNRTVSE